MNQQLVEERTNLKINNVIVCLAYTLSYTDQVKHRTDKIKTAVKGAENVCGRDYLGRI